MIAEHPDDIFKIWSKQNLYIIAMFLACLVYVILSAFWLRKIPEYTFKKDNDTTRISKLTHFVKYSLVTGHDTVEELKYKFGDGLWAEIEKKLNEEKKNV